MPDRPTLTLIDGSSYVFRAYHAIPHLSSSKGVPTNAVYGFALMLLKALRESSPTHVGIAFDKEGRRYRQGIDPEYKANRPPPPEDLVPQFALVRDVVRALNVPALEVQGYEADDVIATLARRAVADGFRVLVITGDKDFMQLVGEHVELYDSMNDRHTTAPDVEARLGVRPDQVVEYLALVGDAVDNVPGVPKVGPKTAVELVRRFGTVESLLERVEEVPASGIRGAKGIADSLRANAEQLRRAKVLVTLKDDLEIPLAPTELARRPVDDGAVRKLFGELEFSRLLKDLPQPAPSSSALAPSAPWAEVETVLTREGLDALAQVLASETGFALKVVCQGERSRVEPIVGLALAVGARAFYVPLAHAYLGAPRQLAAELVVGRLRALLEDPARTKRAHDAKSDILALRRLGARLGGLELDVELASYLLNPSRREHALADLTRERLERELPVEPHRPGGKARPVSDSPVEESGAWAGACAAAIEALAPPLKVELGAAGLSDLASSMELPLVPILAEMEIAGIRVDRKVLQRLGEEVGHQLVRQEKEVHRHAGRELNVNSNPQLAAVLFDELKLPVLRRGKTGPSVDQEVLEKLAAQHPLPRAVIDYRSLFKLKTTYLDALPLLVESDGRIHTSFHQAATATGRLSSSDPNLQNIPVRTDLGKRIREAFVADEGCLFVSADYSQIELRVLAHVSCDEALLAAFARGEDVHSQTAAEVFGVPVGDVRPEMRRVAKAINFGIAYGLSAYGLGQRLDLPAGEAQGIIDRYFARFRGVRLWLDQTVEKVRRDGEVSTLFGRRRFVPEMKSKNPAARQAAERIAVNTPIQGTAADLVKRAMIEVDRRLKSAGLEARMLLQVHDELLLEAPEAEVEEVRRLVTDAMGGAGALKVPLLVEAGVGRSWAQAH